MLRLKDREWKSFKVGHLFSIEPCKCSKASGLNSGSVPYVGATNRNNGVMSFVEDKSNLVTKGNCIAFICDGQGSVGSSIYKAEDFIGSTTIKAGRNEFLNKYTALFFTSVMDKNKELYDYGYKRSLQRLRNEVIQLPSIDGEPDYAFMEAYGKQLMARKISEYEDYARKALGKVEYKEVPLFADKNWTDFFIEDICAICSGMDIYDAERISGNTPYISSTARNNGIGYFVNNRNTTLASGCISVNRNGSVGYSFYHPYNGLFSNDCRKLTLSEGTNFAGFFLANQISAQRGKYNYGYKMGTARLKRQKIMLPVDGNGVADFDYMEQYAKNTYRKKIEEYLDYLGVVKASLQAQPQ